MCTPNTLTLGCKFEKIMGAPKQTLGRSQSNDNLWSGAQAFKKKKRPYPARGQYYVNVNILASRGAISLDETGWRQLISGKQDDSENVYEPMLKVGESNLHRNTRQHVLIPKRTGTGSKMEKTTSKLELDQIHDPQHRNVTCPIYGTPRGTNHQITTGDFPSSGHQEVSGNTPQRKGASKLLRSLKRFKQRLLTTKKGVETSLSYADSVTKRDTKPETSVPVTTAQQPTVVKVTNQNGTYIYASSKARPETATSVEFRKYVSKQSGQSSRYLDSHYAIQTYPDIIQSHNNNYQIPSTDILVKPSKLEKQSFERDQGQGHFKRHIEATTLHMNKPRKSNLKRQMVIRLPSSSQSALPNSNQYETVVPAVHAEQNDAYTISRPTRDGDIPEFTSRHYPAKNGLPDRNNEAQNQTKLDNNGSRPHEENGVQEFEQLDTGEIQHTNKEAQNKPSAFCSFPNARQASNRKSCHSMTYSQNRHCDLEHRQSCKKQSAIVSSRITQRPSSTPIQCFKNAPRDGYITDNSDDYRNIVSSIERDNTCENGELNTDGEDKLLINKRKIYHWRSHSAGESSALRTTTGDIEEHSGVRPPTPQMQKQGFKLQIYRKKANGDNSTINGDFRQETGIFTSRHTRSQSQKIIRRQKEHKKFNHSKQYLDDRFQVVEVLV